MPAANPDKIKVLKQLSRGDIVFALARKPGTSQLFCGGSDFTVYEIDIDQPKPEAKELGRHASYVTGLALAGTTLVSGGYDGRLIWWNIDSRSKVREVDAHRKWIRAVAAAPDGTFMASVADDMVCRLWDVESGRLIHELRGHEELTPTHFPSMLFACAISPDSRKIATGDKVGHITVWDVESGQSLTTIECARDVHLGWGPATSLHRRDPLPGFLTRRNPTGRRRQWHRFPTSTISDGRARVEVFDWKKGERTHEFTSDKFKGLVEFLSVPSAGRLAARGRRRRQGRILHLLRPRHQESARPRKGPDVRP